MKETALTQVSFLRMADDDAACAATDVIATMQARLQLCRRLAVATHDVRAGNALRTMAQEIEAHIQRLQTEAAKRHKD